MTGYGKSTVTYNDKKIIVEIKSLNSKALDVSARIAPLYREKEMETRDKINELERRQLELKAVMQKSDERALKCAKSGLNFQETYPEDWTSYETAREKYNENETALAELYARLAAEREAEQSQVAAAMEE